MRLSCKQSCRFCRSCGALPNNLISFLPTCLIAMDFNNNDDAEFNAAAGAICHGDSVNRGTSTVYSNDASLYN